MTQNKKKPTETQHIGSEEANWKTSKASQSVRDTGSSAVDTVSGTGTSDAIEDSTPLTDPREPKGDKTRATPAAAADQVRTTKHSRTGTDEPSDGLKSVKTTKRRTKSGARTGADDGTGADSRIGADGRTGADDALIEKKQVRTGRKPGAKDLKPRKRRWDRNIDAQISPDDKQMIVHHNVEVWSLGKLTDRNDENEVRERIRTYFFICEKNQQMPTVAGLALAFGVDRTTLWTWMDGKAGVIKNPAVVNTIKEVYNLIASQYEGLLTEGKIVPVAGFFLMQNNFGYKNQTDHVVVAQPAEEPATDELAARAGLLDDAK